MTRFQNLVLVVTLVAAMMASTFQFFAIAVLSSELIDEFGMSRGALGVLGAVTTGGGALLAPALGRWTDRLGGRLMTTAVLGVCGVGLFLTAFATNYAMLMVASFVAGGPGHAAANPATNRLIGQHVAVGRRGLITGWKQSGVQLGIFLSGLTMPGLADLVGWRWAFAGYGIVIVALGVLALVGLPADLADDDPPAVDRGRRPPLPPVVGRLALYGLLIGVFAGGVGRFLPLFSEERLGYSAAVAGLVAALAGLMGIAGRLVWGVAVERGHRAGPALSLIALGAAATGGLLVLSAHTVAALVWPVAVLVGFTSSAWNVVGMLTVIRDSPARDTGRATGLVTLGFLSGLTIGAPLTGWVVDATGHYTAGWVMLSVFAVGAAPVLGWRRRIRLFRVG